MVASITDTQGIVAIAAGAVALVALISCAVLSVSVRRLRRAQRLVLGDSEEQDMVGHAAALQEAFEALRSYVQETAVRLDGRLAGVETALRGRIAHRALVRYDAYNELSGQQSMSIALLDDEQSGIVLSCIHHRDQARVYGKQVRGGRGELELSPEEAEAVRLALAPPGGAPARSGGAAGDEQPA
jgi:CRISPR/Cas system CMR-associated protein Cmr1 (group 7 of RAMP superfamily)